MRNQKGIGLIALTITIIVMVILAGVTLIAAFADGGVIDRAQGAIKENEKKEVKEIIMSSFVYNTVASATNSQVYLDLEKTGVAIYDNLTSNGFTVLNGEPNLNGEMSVPIKNNNEIEVEVQGKHDEYGYVVEKEGNIKENGVDDDNDDKTFNPWIERGLKVPVQYDTKYFNTIWNNNKYEYLECILYSNGGGKMFGSETSNEEINEAIEYGYIKVNSNTIEASEYEFIISEDGEKIEIISKGVSIGFLYTEEQEIDPVVYSNTDGSISLIEISATEAIVYYHSAGMAAKTNIYPCSNLKSIPGYNQYTLYNKSNISYSKLLADSYKPSGYVYSNSDDKWYVCGYAVHGMSEVKYEITIADDKTYNLERNTTMSKEEIDSIIQAANVTNE